MALFACIVCVITYWKVFRDFNKWFLLVCWYFRLLVTRGQLRVRKSSGGETRHIPILSWESLVPFSVWPASLTPYQSKWCLISIPYYLCFYLCFATFTISSRQPTTKPKLQVVDPPNLPSVSAAARGQMIALQNCSGITPVHCQINKIFN